MDSIIPVCCTAEIVGVPASTPAVRARKAWNPDDPLAIVEFLLFPAIRQARRMQTGQLSLSEELQGSPRSVGSSVNGKPDDLLPRLRQSKQTKPKLPPRLERP